jgi:uncharacterized protein YqgC (DUF456 family)
LAEAAGIVALIIVCLVAILLTVIRMPGTWLIVVAALIFAWLTGWERMPPAWIGLLAGIALLGEGVELLASVITARRAGATKQAAWGGLIGGFLGMLVLSPPLLIIGTFLGAILGCFLGAAVAEMWMRNHVRQGARVGFFSAVGFVIGAATKIGLAMAMAGITIIRVLWPTASTVGASLNG